MPTGGTACGYDGGDNSNPICGAPAAWHLYAGSPETGPADFCMTACEEHFPAASHNAWDWHEFGGVCDMPGTMWQSRAHQGEGFCYWPEAESVMLEEASSMQVTT